MSTGSRVSSVLAALVVATPLAGQESDCKTADLNVIFQSAPVEGPGHQTPELFYEEIERMTVAVEPGQVGTATVYGAIVSQLSPDAASVTGWAMGGLARGDIALVSVTTDGTAGADAPEGVFDNGFRVVRVDPETQNRFACFKVAEVPSFTTPAAVALAPRGTATIFALTVEAASPQGSPPLSGFIEWGLDDCGDCLNKPPSGPVRADGQGGCGSPFQILLTVHEETRVPCRIPPLDIRFVDLNTQDFLRGDTNADGTVDISDPIRTLMYLFLGADEPSCLDAADAFDDGEINIVDAILTLLDFFREGTAITAPGPFECGADPTEDALGCSRDSCD
jgi:hypothetical protein